MLLRDGGRVGHGGQIAPPRDLLDLLVQSADDKGIHLPLQEMVDQAMAFMLAGHETSSVLMTWFVFCMIKYPEVDAELYRELRDKLGGLTPDQFTFEAVADCEFLRMCVDEVLRVFPPVPVIVRVTTAPVDVGGYHIPANTSVMLPFYAIHRMAEHWPQPDSFNPRLHFNRAASAARHRFAFAPFSLGERQCIGTARAVWTWSYVYETSQFYRVYVHVYVCKYVCI